MTNKALKNTLVILTVATLTLSSPPAHAGAIVDFIKSLFGIFQTNKHANPSNDVPVPRPGDENAADKLDIQEYCPDGSANPAFAAQQYIIDLTKNSACAKYDWLNRGVAPKGYVPGMALVFARQTCDKEAVGAKAVFDKAATDTTRDALAHYGKDGSDVNTFALLIGLGMRESSGKYCTGRDGSASNTSADTAEAGLFQTSWNTRSASPEMRKLFDAYKSGKKECFTSTFSQGVKCSWGNWRNSGFGEGADFQKMSKECPAFAADIAAINIRVNSRHYGPLNRKDAEFRTACVSMLEAVKKAVTDKPDLCSGLLKKTDSKDLPSTGLGQTPTTCGAKSDGTGTGAPVTTPAATPAAAPSGENADR